jgi:hypothetical protein
MQLFTSTLLSNLRSHKLLAYVSCSIGYSIVYSLYTINHDARTYFSIFDYLDVFYDKFGQGVIHSLYSPISIALSIRYFYAKRQLENKDESYKSDKAANDKFVEQCKRTDEINNPEQKDEFAKLSEQKDFDYM